MRLRIVVLLYYVYSSVSFLTFTSITSASRLSSFYLSFLLFLFLIFYYYYSCFYFIHLYLFTHETHSQTVSLNLCFAKPWGSARCDEVFHEKSPMTEVSRGSASEILECHFATELSLEVCNWNVQDLHFEQSEVKFELYLK